MISPLPTNFIFPIPGPILFPGYATAAGNNPAALGATGKGAAIQGAYAPGANWKEYFAGLTATSQKMGIGVGYIGDDFSGYKQNSAFAGAGFQIDPIAIGIGARKIGLSSNASPSVDLGLIAGEGAGKGQGLRFGFVAYNLNSSASLDLGVGFSGGKKYNMEVNFLLPTSGGNNTSVITIAGNVYASDAVGINFSTSFASASNAYLHKLGLALWPWDAVSLFGQYATIGNFATSGSMITGGLMVTF